MNVEKCCAVKSKNLKTKWDKTNRRKVNPEWVFNFQSYFPENQMNTTLRNKQELQSSAKSQD